MRTKVSFVRCCFVLLLIPPSVSRAQTNEPSPSQGELLLNARLRYEHADENNDLRDANATTLRVRLGYGTPTWLGFDALAEYTSVFALGGDGHYNSGPAFLDDTNGRTTFTTIADPTGHDLNQAWVRYRGLADTAVTLGRQRLALDNHRFIGDVGWRQHEQTFHAVSIVNTALPETTLTYGYLAGQRFIFLNENDLSAHVLHARFAGVPHLALAGYVHLIDFDDDAGPRAPGAPDHRNLGLRAELSVDRAGLNLEYASQSAYADAPDAVDADYWLAEVWAGLGLVSARAGYEVLGGDGHFGFTTPLATNHKFQGFADVFLSTPPNGVRDTYVTIGGPLATLRLTVTYHDFSADAGSGRYGREIDAAAERRLSGRFSVLAKYAHYNADGFGVDTRRLWLQVDYLF